MGDASDATVDGPSSFEFGPWPSPRRLTELEVLPGPADSSYDDGVISDDGELFFAAAADQASEDIYRSTLQGQVFSAPQIVTELSDPVATETTLGISPDGRTLLVGRGVGTDIDIFVASRPDTRSAWQTPTPISQTGCVDPNCVNTAGNFEGAGALSPSGRELFFFSNRGGDFDLYRATRSGADQPFDAVEPLTAFNTMDDEVSVTLSPDGLVLVFSRSPAANVDQMELFVAMRETTSDVFAEATPLSELNSSALDDDFAADSMYRWAVIASRRDGTQTPKLYFSQKAP